MVNNREKEAQYELDILEGYNIIPRGDLFQKEDRVLAIMEAKEAMDKVEVDELDDIAAELDNHVKGAVEKAKVPTKEAPAKKDGDNDDDDDDIPGVPGDIEDDVPTGKNKAADINKSKYSLKLLLKLYEAMLNKVGTNVALPISTIDESKGDIKRLGTLYKDQTYYEIFKTMVDTHKVVCEGLSDGKDSKYFDIFEKFLKNVEKHTPKFKKAYTKKQENIVKSIYIASAMYLFEMSVVLSACTVHMFNKGSKSFDKLLEETKDYVTLFNAANNMYEDNENDIIKLLTTELSISEAFEHAFLQSIDNPADIDAELVVYVEGLNMGMGAKNKMVGLAHIAKLLKYGLSISLYKTFAALRYIIYIVNYQKFSITNKINLVKASLELVSADGDANSRNTTRSTVTNDSMNYRADMITASNKATIDAATNDKEEFDF